MEATMVTPGWRVDEPTQANINKAQETGKLLITIGEDMLLPISNMQPLLDPDAESIKADTIAAVGQEQHYILWLVKNQILDPLYGRESEIILTGNPAAMILLIKLLRGDMYHSRLRMVTSAEALCRTFLLEEVNQVLIRMGNGQINNWDDFSQHQQNPNLFSGLPKFSVIYGAMLAKLVLAIEPFFKPIEPSLKGSGQFTDNACDILLSEADRLLYLERVITPNFSRLEVTLPDQTTRVQTTIPRF